MTDNAQDEKTRAWRPAPGGSPKPSIRDTMQTGYAPNTSAEPPADELDRWARWRNATPEERGAALADLLDFVDAVGRFPPKSDMFPGWKRLVRRRAG